MINSQLYSSFFFKVQEELSISKNNYEALNTQLIEELPLLINTALELFNECLAAFVTARKLLCGKITNQYLNLIQVMFNHHVYIF